MVDLLLIDVFEVCIVVNLVDFDVCFDFVQSLIVWCVYEGVLEQLLEIVMCDCMYGDDFGCCMMILVFELVGDCFDFVVGW